MIEALNRLKLMAIPADHQEGGTLIVPGHGRICDVADLDVYQQMVTIVRDRLQDMIKRGMTLEQMKAARPTEDFDPIYGKIKGNWTTDMFIEAAYKSLTSKQDTHASGVSEDETGNALEKNSEASGRKLIGAAVLLLLLLGG